VELSFETKRIYMHNRKRAINTFLSFFVEDVENEQVREVPKK